MLLCILIDPLHLCILFYGVFFWIKQAFFYLYCCSFKTNFRFNYFGGCWCLNRLCFCRLLRLNWFLLCSILCFLCLINLYFSTSYNQNEQKQHYKILFHTIPLN